MINLFQTILAYAKKYWQICFLVIGAILGIFLFRRQDNNFQLQLKKIQDAHDEELKQIDFARAEEKRIHIENEKKLQVTLKSIQDQYDLAKKDLDAKKKKEIENIVKQYGSDPDELAKQLSNATGFSIISTP